MTRKEVVVFVQAVVVNNKLLVIFVDSQKREMSSSALFNVCSKKEIGQEIHDPMSDLTTK